MGFREQVPDSAVAMVLRGLTVVERQQPMRVPIGGYARRQYLERDVNSMLLLSAQTIWCGGNPRRALACQGLGVSLDVIRGLAPLAKNPKALDEALRQLGSHI
jgi:hypothetical protein